MFLEIINNFSKAKVLVVGDIMIDKYVFGSVDRISVEAPVPILLVKNEKYVLGGAANVANNIASLGGSASLIGVIGKDRAADIFKRELNNANIVFEGLELNTIPTTEKIRIVGNKHQLVRVDYESVSFFEEKALCQKIESNIKDFDIVVISDYKKGVVTKGLVDFTKNLCLKENKKLVVDPRPPHKSYYKGTYAITPNQKEVQEMTDIQIKDDASLIEAGNKIVQELNCNVLITRGPDGMSLFETNGSIMHIPTQAKEVFDVSGAGDTVVSVLALALVSGANLIDASQISNHAAGIVVSKIGTATVSQQELIDVLESEHKKIKSRSDLRKIVEDLKLKDKKIVFTNGVFDLIHSGHTKLLQQARKFGDILIVGINSDSSVKKIKGPTRPIINQDERLELLSSLESVNYLVLFDETDPCKLISELTPDIHVKGGDYDPNNYEKMPEAKIVKEYGGQVKIVKLTEGKSTTNIIKMLSGSKD